jgi:hypothetical protein
MTAKELDGFVESVYHPEDIVSCFVDDVDDVDAIERLGLVEVVQEHIRLQILAASRGEDRPIEVDRIFLGEASAKLTNAEYENVCHTIIGIMEGVAEELRSLSRKSSLAILHYGCSRN